MGRNGAVSVLRPAASEVTERRGADSHWIGSVYVRQATGGGITINYLSIGTGTKSRKTIDGQKWAGCVWL